MRSPDAINEMKRTAETFGAPVALVNGKPTYVEAKGERANKLQKKAIARQTQMLEIGIRAATMFNIRPAEVHAQGPHSSNYPIPACPIGTEYVRTVIPCHELTVVTNEYGDEDVDIVLAIKIAEDIRAQQLKSGHRGVVVVMGEVDPERQMDSRDPAMRNIKKELADEKLAMIQEFKDLLQQANDLAAKSDGSGRKNIGVLHRMAAEYLFHEKLIAKLPLWMVETRNLADVVEPCICGAEPLSKNALQCKACGRWLKVAEAFDKGELTLDMPGAISALQRLSKEELKARGLYPHIKPFAEANLDWIKQQNDSDKPKK